jgi:nicotinate-nucleotide adenylyltransferase
MRLGIFGGTFDPVHYGHLLLAECCREQCPLDAVWFLPAAVPPHKRNQPLTPAAARVEMLELGIAGHPAFAVSRYEVDRGGVNYTVDTLAYFRGQDPEGELSFLLGADMLHDLPNWREPARVCELATAIVVRRSGTDAVDLGCLSGVVPPETIDRIRRHQVEMPEIGISSTEIRRRVSQRRSIRYQTPRAVEKYIQTHGLYGATKQDIDAEPTFRL